MRLAGAAQLKVLLYLLRHAGENTELSELSRVVGLAESDTADAVSYWAACGVLSFGGAVGAVGGAGAAGGTLSPPKETGAAQTAADIPAPPEIKWEEVKPSGMQGDTSSAEKRARTLKSERTRYPFDECAEFISADKKLRSMLLSVESILAKQLNHTEISVFVSLNKFYGLKNDIITMLVHYCKSIAKTNIAYIEATGIGWSDDGVDSVKKAEEKVSCLNKNNAAWRKVTGLFGIEKRKPSEREEQFCCAWVYDWNFSDQMLTLAYEKCVEVKGKLSFAYLNGILKRWFEGGISTPEMVEENDTQNRQKSQKEKKSGNGRYEPTYDADEIEALLDEEWLSEASAVSGGD
jgi:DnaD/phage-associated family protein